VIGCHAEKKLTELIQLLDFEAAIWNAFGVLSPFGAAIPFSRRFDASGGPMLCSSPHDQASAHSNSWSWRSGRCDLRVDSRFSLSRLRSASCKSSRSRSRALYNWDFEFPLEHPRILAISWCS
jgi:hypothetical protein